MLAVDVLINGVTGSALLPPFLRLVALEENCLKNKYISTHKRIRYQTCRGFERELSLLSLRMITSTGSGAFLSLDIM